MRMTERSQKLLSEAMSLPEEERVELASELLATLDGPTDADAETQWAQEIARRLEEYEKDPARAESWEVVKARIRHKVWGKKSAR
jgi:putative addiction module component (TIGR02574 family)